MSKGRDRQLAAAEQRLQSLQGVKNLKERMAIRREIANLKQAEVQRILDTPRRK